MPWMWLLASPNGVGQLLASPTGVGQPLASPSGVGQLLASPNGVGQLLASPSGVGQLLASLSRLPAAGATSRLLPGSAGLPLASPTGESPAMIQPGECSRLKRPLEPSSPSSTAKKARGHHSQRKGMWTSQHNGVKRATFLSLAEPVDTPEELSLFDTLSKLPQVKKGTDLDFVVMSRLWNEELVRSVQQQQEAGMQGVPIRPKTKRQLRDFHKKLTQAICSRRGAGMAEALSGLADFASPSMAPSAQATLGVMQKMMAMAKPVGPSIPPAPCSFAGAEQRRTFASKAKVIKSNKQGQGSKKCGGCGWSAAADGSGISLYKHRETCLPFIAKHPPKK